MDENDYNELFGVTPEGGGPELQPEGGPAPELDPERQGQSGQEGAEPAREPQPEADPAQPESRQEGQGAAIPASEAEPAPSQEEAAARARVDAQKAIDEAFALSGLKNPYTGQPITSKAEYDAYKEQFDRERKELVLKQTGMSGEEFDRFVRNLPEVREARQAREEAERAVREARQAAARVKVEEQVREITAMDPSVKSLADLAKMDTYPRFYELVKRGNTLTDAFRLANFDALAQRAAAGGRQAAANSLRSKEHLEQTRTRGKGAVSVPAEVREQYLFLNPGVTEEEIQKHYQKYHKGG